MNQDRGSRYFFAGEREWQDAPDGVRYVRFSTTPGDPASPMVVLSELPPGHVEPPHTHGCDYMEIVVDGGIRVGKVDMGPGDVRATKAGAGYGPLVAGPSGCLRLTIFDRADGSPAKLLGEGANARDQRFRFSR